MDWVRFRRRLGGEYSNLRQKSDWKLENTYNQEFYKSELFTIILPVDLYGYETWRLVVRSMESRLCWRTHIKKVYSPEREDVREGLKKLLRWASKLVVSTK
jgi:hypothetical protein